MRRRPRTTFVRSLRAKIARLLVDEPQHIPGQALLLAGLRPKFQETI
nr:hypothetical protein JVH1_6906 [Rhodococcus sp. JVH1]